VCKNDHKGAHSQAHSVREFLATKQIPMLEHPTYSSDVIPNHFFLFPKIKEILKGRHFENNDIIKQQL
jgi:hypothetical protein